MSTLKFSSKIFQEHPTMQIYKLVVAALLFETFCQAIQASLCFVATKTVVFCVSYNSDKREFMYQAASTDRANSFVSFFQL